MRQLPLTLASALLLSACGDDGPTQDPTDGSTTTTADDTTGTTVTPDDTTGTTETPTTTDASTTAVDSTGPAVVCGNGIVEEGEECDDENVVNDDACYSNCTIPFEILWTASVPGDDADVANYSLFDADGNLYVLGTMEVAGQGADLWLRQFTADGREGWTWTYNGALDGDDVGRGMAWLDGDLVIAGSEQTENEVDMLVMRLSLAGDAPTVVWTQYYDGPGLGTEPIDDADFAIEAVVDGAGDIIVAGTQRVDGQEYDLWLRKYDADGNALWTHEYNDANVNGNDTTQGVVVDANGDIYLAANSEVGPNAFEGLVRKLDADGTELWTQTVPLVFFTHAALDPDGNLVLVGLDDDNPENGNMWAGKYDPDFGPIATTTFDGPSGAFDQALGVAVDGQGDVYMTGFVTVVGEQSNVWIGRYEDDLGLRLWSDSYGNTDSNLADDGRHVALNADGSRVAVVGFESVIGDDTNIWVRVYQNNPAP